MLFFYLPHLLVYKSLVLLLIKLEIFPHIVHGIIVVSVEVGLVNLRLLDVSWLEVFGAEAVGHIEVILIYLSM